MIRCLNLDPSFQPIKGCEKIRFDKINFPGGESQIRLDNDINYENIDIVIITHRYSSTKGDKLLTDIAFAKDALERKGVKHFELYLPYFPHARQDRVTVEGEAFTLKVFANFINSLKFDKVRIYDAHSEVTTDLLENSVSESNYEFVYWVLRHARISPVLIASDEGARKKCKDLFQYPLFSDYSICNKIRNPETGKLSQFIAGRGDYEKQPCLIVDDICDGGGTFIGLAEELKASNAGDLYLAVSHGIFSKGISSLYQTGGNPDGFKGIYTTNSIKTAINTQEVHRFNLHHYGK